MITYGIQQKKQTLKNISAWVALAFFQSTLLAPGAVAFAQVGQGTPVEAVEAPAPEPVATEDRRVAVFVLPKSKGDEGAAKVLQTVFRSSVNALVGVRAVGGVGMPDSVWEKQVSTLLAQGDELLNQDPMANPEASGQATEVFREAIAILEANPGAGDNRLWAHAFKGLAVGLVMSGKSNEAYGNMKASLTLYPLQSAIEYGYTLPVQTMYERIIQDQSVEASGELEVVSMPAGAEVQVDGQRKGFADPLRLTNLTAGKHRVSVLMDGYYVWDEIVEIPSGDVYTVSAELEEDENWKAVSTSLKGIKRKIRSPKKADMFVQSLKEATGATEALIVEVGVGRSGVFTIRGLQAGAGSGFGTVELEVARDGNFFEVVRQFVEMQFVSTTAPEGAAGALSMPSSGGPDPLEASLTEDLTLNPDAPMFETEDDQDSLLSKWWFWTAVGVGVAGAATAIAVPLALANDDDGGKGPTGALQFQIQQPPVQ